jgi:hypothetical protein
MTAASLMRIVMCNKDLKPRGERKRFARDKQGYSASWSRRIGVPEQREKRTADVARRQEDDPRRFLAISDKENDDDYFFADCTAGLD